MNKLNERLTWIFQELSKIAESLNWKKSIIRCKDCAAWDDDAMYSDPALEDVGTYGVCRRKSPQTFLCDTTNMFDTHVCDWTHTDATDGCCEGIPINKEKSEC